MISVKVYFRNSLELEETKRRAIQTGKSISLYIRDLILEDHIKAKERRQNGPNSVLD